MSVPIRNKICQFDITSKACATSSSTFLNGTLMNLLNSASEAPTPTMSGADLSNDRIAGLLTNSGFNDELTIEIDYRCL